MLTSLAAAVSSGPPPVLPGFLASLASPLEHYGLWAVALFVLVEDFGIPVPGETVLIAGAVFAGSGRLNVVAVGIVGFLAAVAGDNIGYAIGRFGGRALVERWGRYVFLTRERLDKAERFFARHGGKIIVVARFIEGLRQANGIIAGISGMRWLKFLACNALGAALWVGTWVSVGYFAGQHITSIYDVITRYSLYAAIAAVAAIAGWLLLHLRKRRRTAAAPPPRAPGLPTPSRARQRRRRTMRRARPASRRGRPTSRRDARRAAGGRPTSRRDARRAGGRQATGRPRRRATGRPGQTSRRERRTRRRGRRATGRPGQASRRERQASRRRPRIRTRRGRRGRSGRRRSARRTGGRPRCPAAVRAAIGAAARACGIRACAVGARAADLAVAGVIGASVTAAGVTFLPGAAVAAQQRAQPLPPVPSPGRPGPGYGAAASGSGSDCGSLGNGATFSTQKPDVGSVSSQSLGSSKVPPPSATPSRITAGGAVARQGGERRFAQGRHVLAVRADHGRLARGDGRADQGGVDGAGAAAPVMRGWL